MANPPVLAGQDVAVFSLGGNGIDGHPNATTQYGLIGVWQDVTFDFDLRRSENTPSSQLLLEKRLTGLDWTCQLNNLIRSGGGFASYLLFSGYFNVRLVFQEEVSGATWTAYGGLTKASMKAVREARTESLTIENIGPVGTTGSSVFYTYGGAITASQSIQTVGASVNAVQAYSRTSAIAVTEYTPDAAGFHGIFV
jgi:hypothetical protein